MAKKKIDYCWRDDNLETDEDVMPLVQVVPYRGAEKPQPQRTSKVGAAPRPPGHLERLEQRRRDMIGRCIVCGERHFGEEELCRFCGGKLVR